MTAAQIVSKQIEAYNNKDLEGNMALFNEHFKMINFSDGVILINGKEACREMYALLFANSPKLFAEVIGRIDFDSKVVLHEYIYGRNGDTMKMEQLLIFEVENQKINKIFKL